jgi:hypothetical protein
MGSHKWNILTRGAEVRKDILGSSPMAQAMASFPGPDGVVVEGVLVGLVAGGLVLDVLEEGGVDEGVLWSGVLLLPWAGGFVG